MVSNPEMVVVIATCRPGDLLRRTLKSLESCSLPQNLTRVIVAENGAESTAREMVLGYSKTLPVEYRFFENAKKCGALNRALSELGNVFVVYFDDDVRIHPESLMAYSRAVQGVHSGRFFGGRCEVDYDRPPEAWLLPLLPAAAVGWAPSEAFSELKSADALGFNWGVFADDLRLAGGYDERCGPGTDANSDETNVQESLLRNGVRFFFLPDAVVWHYVPSERCSPEWLLDYKRKNGKGKGIAYSEKSPLPYAWQMFGSISKLAWFRLLLLVPNGMIRSNYRFYCQMKRSGLEGKINGMMSRFHAVG